MNEALLQDNDLELGIRLATTTTDADDQRDFTMHPLLRVVYVARPKLIVHRPQFSLCLSGKLPGPNPLANCNSASHEVASDVPGDAVSHVRARKRSSIVQKVCKVVNSTVLWAVRVGNGFCLVR
jgi:hypothetical protein